MCVSSLVLCVPLLSHAYQSLLTLNRLLSIETLERLPQISSWRRLWFVTVGQIHSDITNPLHACLSPRKPLWQYLICVDIRSQWKENWKLAQVVNFSQVDDPGIRQPGFNFPRQQWSLLNCFPTAQGHCGAGEKKWNQAATDLCPCGEKQTMSHVVDSCPLSKLNGGLYQLHSADDEGVAWLISYGS